jgi:hypothetical protein
LRLEFHAIGLKLHTGFVPLAASVS